MVELTEGQIAPDFTMSVDGGGQVSLGDLKDKIVVLYFYPKDNTPGCTTEAIGFSQLEREFDAAGARVIGVSKDSVKKHDNFKAKHDLKVTLASDPDGRVVEDWGVWVEKTLYGRKYMGIERATFVINRQGQIARIWRKVKVKGHADEVLEFVRSLSAEG